MKLISVYQRPDRHIILWRLLKERDASVNISHREMPSYQEHVRFVDSRPYEHWYFIEAESGCVGACYLTRRNEIGVQVFKAYQWKGYAREALSKMMAIHTPLPAIPSERRGEFVANINPDNPASVALFRGLGFKLIQHTYSLSRLSETSNEQSANTPELHTA